jgi:hypothetical protein
MGAVAGSIEYQDRNKEIIEAFVKTLPSLSVRRIYKYRIRLGKISRDLGKPFDKVSMDDLRGYVARVNESPDYTDSTKADYRNFLKKFFGWLNGKYVHLSGRDVVEALLRAFGLIKP